MCHDDAVAGLSDRSTSRRVVGHQLRPVTRARCPAPSDRAPQHNGSPNERVRRLTAHRQYAPSAERVKSGIVVAPSALRSFARQGGGCRGWRVVWGGCGWGRHLLKVRSGAVLLTERKTSRQHPHSVPPTIARQQPHADGNALAVARRRVSEDDTTGSGDILCSPCGTIAESVSALRLFIYRK